MSLPDITDEELRAVSDVLRSGQLSIGPQIEAFEHEFANALGAPYACAVSSGTSALHLAVIAAIDGGPRRVRSLPVILTSPFSFVASANVALYENAVPVFVDIDAATFNIDPDIAVNAIRDLKDGGAACERWLPRSIRGDVQLSAVMPVHAFGQPCDMDPIVAAAAAAGVPVIEDACEAIGATYKGQLAGTIGDAGVFAFYPNKQMTTGEGGVVVTRRSDWASLFRSLRNQGRDVFDSWLNHSRLGYNYRLDEMSASLGRVQLRRLDTLLANRERVATWYTSHLSSHELLRLQVISPRTTRMSWFVYVVRLDAQVDRDHVMALLSRQGIPTRPYFSPIHMQRFYRERFDYRRGDFPVTEDAGSRCLALPFSGLMTESQVTYVSDALVSAVESATTRRSA